VLLIEPPAPRALTVPDAPTVIVARNFDPMYDIGTALAAFEQIAREFPGARLELFGEGTEREPLAQRARERGIPGVTFHGSRPPEDLARCYAEAALALNPSTVDNTPNSLVEAMAFGVPVVSTDVGGVPELTEQGAAAVLVPPRDPQAMGRAAVAILRDPARATELQRAGLQVASRFRWSGVYAAFLAAGRGIDAG
jgi:glycosyltransferase involved in cell wall biosynthesis